MTASAASSTAISAIAQSAGTVTVTAAGHGLSSSDLVSIDGVADYTYTGLVTVNVTNANVFTYSRTTTNASSSGGYVTKLQGTWASYSGGTGPSYKGGPMVIEASSQMPALRVTQGGSGYALIVEDAANPDTSAFIISNAGDLAINTNKFTVAAASGNTVIGGTTSLAGNVTFATDATYDIGASGATRPRDLYLSRNLVVGGTLTLAGGVNLNGNVTIGDASSDTLTITSTITSNLIFTDNTYDIGASGATRPRNAFLAGNLGVGGVYTAGNGSIQSNASSNRFFEVGARSRSNVELRLAASEGGWEMGYAAANNAGTYLGGFVTGGNSQALNFLSMRVGSTDVVSVTSTYTQIQPNVLIGTTTSGGLGVQTGLTVVGGATVSDNTPGALTLGSHGNARTIGSEIGKIDFYSNDASSGASGVQASIRGVTGTALGDYASLYFYTGSSGALSLAGAVSYAQQWSMGAAGADGNFRLTLWGAAGQNAGMSIYETSTGNNARLRVYQAAANVYYDATYSAGGNTHNFQVGSGTIQTISSAGVSIGNTTANQKLDVWNGDISLSSSSAGGTGEVFRFAYGTTSQMIMNLGGATGFQYSTVSTTSYGQLTVRPNYTDGYPAYSFSTDTTTGMSNAAGTTGVLNFQISGTERARLNGTGWGVGRVPNSVMDAYFPASSISGVTSYGNAFTAQTGTGTFTMSGGSGNQRGVGAIFNANQNGSFSMPFGRDYDNIGVISATNTTNGSYTNSAFVGYSKSDGPTRSFVAIADSTLGASQTAIGFRVHSVAGGASSGGAGIGLSIANSISGASSYAIASDSTATSYLLGTLGVGTTPNYQFEVSATDNTGNRTTPYNVAGITAYNTNAPYSGYGAGLVFKSSTYGGASPIVGARIRNEIGDNSVDSYGSSLIFDVTATRAGSLSQAMKVKYNGFVYSYKADCITTTSDENYGTATFYTRLQSATSFTLATATGLNQDTVITATIEYGNLYSYTTSSNWAYGLMQAFVRGTSGGSTGIGNNSINNQTSGTGAGAPTFAWSGTSTVTLTVTNPGSNEGWARVTVSWRNVTMALNPVA
jgi:hypothetical protein